MRKKEGKKCNNTGTKLKRRVTEEEEVTGNAAKTRKHKRLSRNRGRRRNNKGIRAKGEKEEKGLR